MTDFPMLLDRFAAAVAANDGAGLAALFTADGVYEDGFFGAHRGRAGIAAMLERFHATGRDYRWDFFDPLGDGRVGYARFCFSYASALPECDGKPVVFHGISQFRFAADGLIGEYREAFDRGVALVQLGFPAERLKRILERAAAEELGRPESRTHHARFRQ
jgi:hypothetical protein